MFRVLSLGDHIWVLRFRFIATLEGSRVKGAGQLEKGV